MSTLAKKQYLKNDNHIQRTSICMDPIVTKESHIIPLKILRTIAQTFSAIILDDALEDVVLFTLLLEDGAVVDSETFACACSNGCTEIVRLLLGPEHGIDPSAHNNVALRNACYYGHTEIVRLLLDLPLDRGVDPAAHFNAAFRAACYNKQIEIVHMLLDLPLDRGVDPSARDNEALQHACSRAYSSGHTEIVRLLLALPLERGVDPSARDNAAFMLARVYGCTENARLLLDLPLDRGVVDLERD